MAASQPVILGEHIGRLRSEIFPSPRPEASPKPSLSALHQIPDQIRRRKR